MVWKMLATPRTMIAERGALHDQHTEWHADGDGDEHRDYHQRNVRQSGFQDFRAMFDEEGPRAHAGAPGTGTSDEAKARTSG